MTRIEKQEPLVNAILIRKKEKCIIKLSTKDRDNDAGIPGGNSVFSTRPSKLLDKIQKSFKGELP